jgi:nodulation protein A
MGDIEWTLRWETDLLENEHTALAALLARFYPQDAAVFTGTRSWFSARPEGRLIGFDGGRPVAHLAFVRRMLRLESGGSQLVADVGLVGVDPDFQGNGLGRVLLARATDTFLSLNLPFGFLTCAPELVGFYTGGGWHRAVGVETRMLGLDLLSETFTGPAMVLPVTASFAEWPAGQTIIRDGAEV